MRGRKPVPTTLRELHANPRHDGQAARKARRAVESAAPPVPETGLQMPRNFRGRLAEIWREAIEGAPRNVLLRSDARILAAWCVASLLHEEATEGLITGGSMVPASPTKEGSALVQSPHLAVVNRQAVILSRLSETLGFTPTSRGRLAVAPIAGSDRAPGVPPLAEFLANMN